jgi:hypothetical protein
MRVNEYSWKIYFLLLVLLKWLPSCFFNLIRKKPKPLHILFCMVDHFEPGTGNVTSVVEKERVRTLLSEYPKLVKNHKDYAGNIPKRTWFFPPHYHRNNNLRDLISLCEKGYGEIELHLHHGKTKPDSAENLKRTIIQCIKEYSSFGIFGTENGHRKYGFVHGDWALDNSRNGKYCGVNNEIQILKETGCYADFTFPSLNEANPIQINSIYYAQGDPKKAKSYDRGITVRKSGKDLGDLMIIQGPAHPFLKNNTLSGLRAWGDSINGTPPTTKKRIDLWVKTAIHIRGKREWIIIKTSMHGAEDGMAVLGQEMNEIFSYLETKYNDGKNYVLHYVTARELYNIIKAVEAGEPGRDPEDYRDYKIRPPVYNSSINYPEASEKLKEYVFETYN